jgi:hypothetical protein
MAARRMAGVLGVLLIGALSLGGTPGRSRESSCANDPDVIDTCFTFHGRLCLANGVPSVRILRLGTRRIIGISEQHSAWIPRALEAALTWDDVIYGDFRVCPFTRSEPGKMQFVCLESGSHLILERRTGGARTLRKLPDVSGP